MPAKELNLNAMYTDMGKSNNKLIRGRVWCTTCGTTHEVNSSWCMQHGWPQCCGETMTIDSPEEREELNSVI